MYVCICVCIHVHVCHAYIVTVCHEHIDTCIYLFPVHLDIILPVVSDGDDSTECWNSLFENAGVIEEVFRKNLPIRETSLSLLTVFHTSAVLRAARCRTFPDGLFSVYCSWPRGCASSTTTSSIFFNINGPMLSSTPRGSGDLLGSSTAGMAAGEALAAAGSGCKFQQCLDCQLSELVPLNSPPAPPAQPYSAATRSSLQRPTIL